MAFYYFRYSKKIDDVFSIIKRNIDLHVANKRESPYTLDHPFLVYHAKNNALDNVLLLQDKYEKNGASNFTLLIQKIVDNKLRYAYVANEILNDTIRLSNESNKEYNTMSHLANKKFVDKQSNQTIMLKSKTELLFCGASYPFKTHNVFPFVFTFAENMNAVFLGDNMYILSKEKKLITLMKDKHDISFWRIHNETCLNSLKLFWQYPVITEKEFFLQNKNNDNYFPFPWATALDKGYSPEQLYSRLTSLFDFNKPLYTCCQHIHFRKYVTLWYNLGIKVVYIPHKCVGENFIEGIRLLPCPLYAVNVEDKNRNKMFEKVNCQDIKRKYLYSFMGGYQPIHYLTNIRRRIFNMKGKRKDCCIIPTGGWHFNCDVYGGKQNKEGTLNESKHHLGKTQLYNSLLLQSRYTLAPSGSGPNSIRLWEALAVGSIPIVLADTLELPNHPLWNRSIIKIKEKNVYMIDKILKNISQKEENQRRRNCIEIYNHFKNNYTNSKLVKPIEISKTNVKILCLLESNDKDLFMNIVQCCRYYFEYGMGWTTQYVITNCRQLRSVVSIETDKIFFDNYKDKLNRSDCKAKEDYRFINIESEHKTWGHPGISSRYVNWQKYSSQFSTLPKSLQEKIDTVCIDGRFRVACVLKIHPLISSQCNVIFTDFLKKPTYSIVLKFFTVVLKTKDNSMVILRKKNVKSPLQTLIDKYESIPE